MKCTSPQVKRRLQFNDQKENRTYYQLKGKIREKAYINLVPMCILYTYMTGYGKTDNFMQRLI